MIVGGMYSNEESPPNTTMFIRAGGQIKKTGEPSSMTKAITDAAYALTSVLSPKSNVLPSKGVAVVQ